MDKRAEALTNATLVLVLVVAPVAFPIVLTVIGLREHPEFQHSIELLSALFFGGAIVGTFVGHWMHTTGLRQLLRAAYLLGPVLAGLALKNAPNSMLHLILLFPMGLAAGFGLNGTLSACRSIFPAATAAKTDSW